MKLLAAALFALVSVSASAEEYLKSTLTRQTQEMFDAVSAGDTKVWDRYLAPGVLYIDEAGAVNGRAETVKQIGPLPKGISGTIKVYPMRFQRSGDVAILVHRDEETERYFGQTLHAEYLSMDTWQKQGRAWRLVGEQVLATLKEPPAISLPPAMLRQYAGTFRLKDGALTYTVAFKGGKLFGTRAGKPAAELLAETADVFFVRGAPRIRKIFQHDGSGHITGFVDRREGRDVVWLKQ